MTCAHVVGAADQVKVVIKDREVIGRVIAIDSKNDLALIRVPVQFDRILAFNNTPPELGDECHVIGFPLATQLGVRVKMTSGTISGDDIRMNERRLLVDATMNPGNSGGPVVGENGELFGVADSILTMEQTQDVSFAVPVDVASDLLDRASIPHDKTRYGKGQSDPRSARTLKEAIQATFLILVEQTGPATDPQDLYLLEYETKIEKVGAGASMPSTSRGKLVVDRLGRVLHTDDKGRLPFLLGHPSTIGFETFPEVGNSGWRNIHLSTVMVTVPGRSRSAAQPPARNNPFGFPGGFGFGPPPDTLGELLGGSSSTRVPVGRIQVQAYQFQSGAKYRKGFVVGGIDPESRAIIFTCITEGTVQFDASGFPSRSSVRGPFQSLLGGRRSSGDVQIECDYLDADAIANYEARLAREREEAREQAKQQARAMLDSEKERLVQQREALERTLRSHDATMSKGLSEFDPDK